MSVLVEVFLNNRPVRANIVAVDPAEGWVEIEDLTAVAYDPAEDVTDPTQASGEQIDDLVTPSVKLPTKKLYGNIRVIVVDDQ